MRRIIIALVLRGLRAPYVCVHEEEYEELRGERSRAERAEMVRDICLEDKAALVREFREVPA